MLPLTVPNTYIQTKIDLSLLALVSYQKDSCDWIPNAKYKLNRLSSF